MTYYFVSYCCIFPSYNHLNGNVTLLINFVVLIMTFWLYITEKLKAFYKMSKQGIVDTSITRYGSIKLTLRDYIRLP